ncbi:MAG: WS/DGAT domain-containing protein [Gordonia paraffinivorans]
MRRLTARDAGYVYLPETMLSSRVLSCWVLAPPDGGPSGLRAADIVPLLAGRLAVDDMFGSVLRRLPGDIDHPYWVLDPSADLTDHITVHGPCGMTWPVARRMLAEIADRPFDMARPLWSVDVVVDVDGIPGLPGLSTVLAVSFHHAAFDGIAFEERMHHLLADEPEPHRAPRPIGPIDEPWGLVVARAVARAPLVWTRFLLVAASAVRETRRQARQAHASRALYDRRRALVTRFNRGLHGGRRVDFVPFDLADVDAIAGLVDGATTNDVLLSIVGGAVIRFLRSVDEAPAGSLVCLVPKTTRRRRQSGPDAGSANQFLPLTVDLHTDVDDVLERIAAIAAGSRVEKERAGTVVQSEFWRAMRIAPAPLLRLSGAVARRRNVVGDRTAVNTELSTLVSDTPVATIASVPVVSGFGVAPLGRETTLVHLAVIGLGRVRLSVTADDTVLPDMPAYIRAVRASLDEHLAVVRPAGVRSGGRVE